MLTESERPYLRSSATLGGMEHERRCAAVNGLPDVCTCGAVFRCDAGPVAPLCGRPAGRLTVANGRRVCGTVAPTGGVAPRSSNRASMVTNKIINSPYEADW